MNDNLEDMTRIFYKLHICAVCGKYFTERDNLGAHKCWHHPGKYDSVKDMYPCCGERRRYGNTDYHRYMSYTPDRSQAYRDFSSGCTPCDCVSIYHNDLPYGDVSIRDYAPMLIFIKNIEQRPGYSRDDLNIRRRGTEIKRLTNAQTFSS